MNASNPRDLSTLNFPFYDTNSEASIREVIKNGKRPLATVAGEPIYSRVWEGVESPDEVVFDDDGIPMRVNNLRGSRITPGRP